MRTKRPKKRRAAPGRSRPTSTTRPAITSSSSAVPASPLAGLIAALEEAGRPSGSLLATAQKTLRDTHGDPLSGKLREVFERRLAEATAPAAAPRASVLAVQAAYRRDRERIAAAGRFYTPAKDGTGGAQQPEAVLLDRIGQAVIARGLTLPFPAADAVPEDDVAEAERA